MSDAQRHLTLDVIRGVAVMGILVANLPAFALPAAAYFSPLAAGGTAPADIALWFANFVLVEGKMRGLFSLLFGASMLLVIDRARAAGDDPAGVHFSRMAVLFAIGLIHLYFIWWGDILTHYALCGAIAYPFARFRTGALVAIGLIVSALGAAFALAGLVLLIDSAPRATPQAAAIWNTFEAAFGVPPAADIAREIAATRGGFVTNLAWRWQHATGPLQGMPVLGPQTIGTMLLGMAAYRSGFLTGGWPRARYRRWAIVCLGIALPGYMWLGIETIRHGFALQWVYAGSIAASAPLRLAGMFGQASLVLLLLRPGGALTERIAAVGRTAFTNYLGTSIVMTLIFGGLGIGPGQFGLWSRAALYLLVPLAWAIMLGWSAPWLRRYRYGPLEWAWRSLARVEWQPLRRADH